MKNKPIKPLATGDKTIPPKDARMIPIYIMGREYLVPETLTILKAVEYAGYKYVRGCGCRGGRDLSQSNDDGLGRRLVVEGSKGDPG